VAALDSLQEGVGAQRHRACPCDPRDFDAAKTNLAEAATPEAYNRLVERFISPMEVQPDGNAAQKKSPAADATGDLQ
jgi:hypothetical protein